MRGGAYAYSGGNFYAQSYQAFYWSRGLENLVASYSLYFSVGVANLQSSFVRGYGFYLRCLARLVYNKKVCYNKFVARVVKLVYTYALGAYAARRAGSSPVSGTIKITPFRGIFYGDILLL